MTSFQGLPHLGKEERRVRKRESERKKKYFSPLPLPLPLFLPPLSLTPRPLCFPLLFFALVRQGPYKPHFLSLRVHPLYWGERRVGSRRLVPLLKIRVAGSNRANGRRGDAFGCVEVCVNTAAIHSPRCSSFLGRGWGSHTGATCGHGYTVISTTFIYACAIICRQLARA